MTASISTRLMPGYLTTNPKWKDLIAAGYLVVRLPEVGHLAFVGHRPPAPTPRASLLGGAAGSGVSSNRAMDWKPGRLGMFEALEDRLVEPADSSGALMSKRIWVSYAYSKDPLS